MKTIELDHVAIHVEDVERSCEFYRNVLQLEQIKRPDFKFPGAWFRLGRHQELHIIGERKDPVNSHNRGTHFALQADNLSEWEAHFQKLDHSYRPKVMRPDGPYQIFLKDPDGHVIELFTPGLT